MSTKRLWSSQITCLPIIVNRSHFTWIQPQIVVAIISQWLKMSWHSSCQVMKICGLIQGISCSEEELEATCTSVNSAHSITLCIMSSYFHMESLDGMTKSL